MKAKQRYMRFFPSAWSKLLVSLTPVEIVAYQNVLMEYMQREGALPGDNDVLLSMVAGIGISAWIPLRVKLIMLRIAGVEDGLWVDYDQRDNLEMQLANSKRQSERVSRRHAAKNANDAQDDAS